MSLRNRPQWAWIVQSCDFHVLYLLFCESEDSSFVIEDCAISDLLLIFLLHGESKESSSLIKDLVV